MTRPPDIPYAHCAFIPKGNARRRPGQKASARQAATGEWIGYAAVAGTLGAMSAIDPWLTLFAMAPFPGLVVIAKRFNHQVVRLARVKHADRDPESTHAFNPVSSDFLLIDACEAYMRLTGERRPVLSTYMMWFWIRHPQYYEEVPTASFLKRQYREEQRLLFFREALPRASNPTA